MKRPWLLPLVPLYRAALAIKHVFYSLRLSKSQSLQAPVISIGSVSAGGAGKTPVVLLLARLLQEHGLRVDVLTRGYGRTGTGVERVQLDVNSPDRAAAAERFGDEAVLIAARSGVPVYVASERYKAGLLAEAEHAARTSMASDSDFHGADRKTGEVRGRMAGLVHLLDDGLQHQRLARTIDVVLLTLRDVHDCLLPAGDLREPWRHALQADILIIRDDEAKILMPLLERTTRGRELPVVWVIRRTLRLQDVSCDQPLFAFCGIARPDSFWSMLEAEGLNLRGRLAFPDHHRFTGQDIDAVLSAARRATDDSAGAAGFLTTEKDRVRLTAAQVARLQQLGPVYSPELAVELLDQQAALQSLLDRLGAGQRGRS
jgi:tetraacyldisaccharide 4'-kinase